MMQNEININGVTYVEKRTCESENTCWKDLYLNALFSVNRMLETAKEGYDNCVKSGLTVNAIETEGAYRNMLDVKATFDYHQKMSEIDQKEFENV